MAITRITQLSDEEKGRFNEWADKWIETGLRTGPADREKFESAVRDCYRFAGIPFPKVVVWVPSPMALSIAAPAAAVAIELLEAEQSGKLRPRRVGLRRGAVRGAVRDAVGDAVGGTVGGAVRGAVGGAVGDAVGDAVGGAVRGAVGGAVGDAVGDAVGGTVGGAVRGAVGGAVGDAVGDAVGGAVRGAVGGAVRGAVGDAVGGTVGGAVGGAVGDAVRGTVRGAVDGAVRDAVDGAVRGAVDGAVGGTVRDAVGGAVRGAVRGTVDDAVGGTVGDAVGDAVRGAVGGAVGDAVGDAVRGAVRGAVRDAVGDAVRGAVDDADREIIRQGVLRAIRTSWSSYIGGQFWSGGWWWGAAYTSYFREVCKLELGNDLWERGRAYEATVESACWWWPHRRFVMVSERPLAIHRELTNPDVERGWGSHRLHCDDGPAIVWPDGWGIWAVHGVRVSQQIVEAPETLTVDQILGEQNTEIRRVMIERFGYERLLEETDAELVDADVDEIGAARELRRIVIRGDEDIVAVRVVNSSVEPDGSYRRYLLRVPPGTRTCREAVAWTFDVPAGDYDLAAQT